MDYKRLKQQQSKFMQKITHHWALALFLFLTFFQAGKLRSSGYAIIGGNDNSSPYVSLVSPDGVTSFLNGPNLPVGSGSIRAVGINDSMAGIIGGSDGNGFYVSLVDKNGTTKALVGTLPVSGSASVVAINPSGAAVIGGQNLTAAYAALVQPDGTLVPLSGSNLPTAGIGAMRAVAISASGHAIIGGQNQDPPIANRPYVSLVDPSGVTTALSGPALPTGPGTMYSVAINSSNFSIIGGGDQRFSRPYVALVDPSGVTTALSGPAVPSGLGSIFAVDINDSGNAIIGGRAGISAGVYVALVDPNGVATSLSGPVVPTGPGRIFSVAINPSGVSVIGGALNNTPFAALVDPNGVTTALSGAALPTGTGQITSVAINPAGCAIIGGSVDNSPYMALVAPNGSTTALSGPALPVGTGTIFSVAINTAILKTIDPKSVGFGNVYADPLFTLSSVVLKKHLSFPENIQTLSSESTAALSLIADGSDKIYLPSSHRKNPKFAIWASPFGFRSKYKEQSAFPSIHNKGIGGILGFDYYPWEKGTIGGGLVYAYQNMSSSEGKGKSHQELLTFYAAVRWKCFLMQGALSGGIYQLDNCRKTLGFISSDSSIHGGLFAPHLNIQRPISLDKLTITPFLELDWVNNWQRAISEHGESGLNLRIPSHYTSILRTELGIFFQQQKRLKRGIFRMEEGISYINQKPFRAAKVPTSYVGSISTFDIQLFSNQIQNLGALSITSSFTPNKETAPSIALNYQGKWGKKQLFHTLTAEIKKKF